jgi:RNA polymerase sigma-70 factor (sigma-E family)
MAGWSDAEFDAFVAARQPSLLRFAYTLTGDAGHAEDVVQTALMKAYLATRRRPPDAPEAYVRQAIVRANIARFRRHRVPEVLSGAVPEQRSQHDDVEQVDALDALAHRLAGLSKRQRTVVVLRYVEDWSETEIATAMGVTVGTVKTLSHRALTHLRADEHVTQPAGRRTR